jgi:hypothetical protein
MPHHQNLQKLRKELGDFGDRIGLSMNHTYNTYTVNSDSKYYHLKLRLFCRFHSRPASEAALEVRTILLKPCSPLDPCFPLDPVIFY